MSLFPPSWDNLELIRRLANLFIVGGELAVEMESQNELTFGDWAIKLRSNPELSCDITDYARLEWIWNTLRRDPALKSTFSRLPPADSVWNHDSRPVKVLNAGAWFSIGLDKDSATGLLWEKEAGPGEKLVIVQIREDLFMRPGKGDRLECCDCHCEVVMRVNELFGIDREADLMRVEPGRIRLEFNEIRVQADSLNEAYTISSRRLQPKRRSHGGRIYDHFMYRNNKERLRLEDIRLSVEHGAWQIPQKQSKGPEDD